MAKKSPSDRVLEALSKYGLKFPGAHLKSPWPGHADLAVNNKTFAYLSIVGEPFSISCKLSSSWEEASDLDYTKPTGYGLGRSGWVTADFDREDTPPLELFKQWIEESYRIQAPKKLIKELDGVPAKKAAPKKKATPTKRKRT